MTTGTVELGKVCVLLNGNRDPIELLAEEAADRITSTPEAKAKLYAFILYYMNRAVEVAHKD